MTYLAKFLADVVGNALSHTLKQGPKCHQVKGQPEKINGKEKERYYGIYFHMAPVDPC